MILIPGILVSAFSIIVLMVYFKQKVTWFEILLPPVLSMLIGILIKGFVLYSIQTDVEYLGTWVKSTFYSEPYTTWREVDDYCTRTITEKGVTRTERYKCGSHTEYDHHPPHWWVSTSHCGDIDIDQDTYERLKSRFGNTFQSQGHHDDYHIVLRGYHATGQGFLHESTFFCPYGDPSKDKSFTPVTVSHRYKNPILAANQSLFHFRKVSKEEKNRYNILDYPPIQDFFVQDAIVGNGPITFSAQKKLKIANASLGSKRQVKMFIFLYKNQPIEAAFAQESYLQGGNKNEFILAIGTDEKDQVMWSYPISWSQEELLKVRIRDSINQLRKLDIDKAVDLLITHIDDPEFGFRRRPFKDFNYLSVEVPWWGYVLSFALCVLANSGLGMWIVRNEWEEF